MEEYYRLGRVKDAELIIRGPISGLLAISFKEICLPAVLRNILSIWWAQRSSQFPYRAPSEQPQEGPQDLNGVSERITPHTSLAAGLEESPGDNGCSEMMKLEEWDGFFLFHFLIPCANREAIQPLYGCLIDWEGHLLFTSQWSWLKEGISHLIHNPGSVCQSEAISPPSQELVFLFGVYEPVKRDN